MPVWDDARLFEFLVLESAQSGLSWITILRKREAYRLAFAGFDPARVAQFGEADYETLMQNAGIVRNRLKVRAAIGNARAFLKVQEEFGSFARYQWSFVDGQPVHNQFRELSELPAFTDTATAFSRDLKKRGFTFVGPTVIYSHMQATGMVNDHLVGCYRWTQLAK